ncbi:MAG: hypothetical protein ACOC46_03055 [Pirellulales bacterium]
MANRVKLSEMQTQQQQETGLICRGCGCRHFRVLYTRSVAGSRIMRRRECRHCGRRITTHEVAGF